MVVRGEWWMNEVRRNYVENSANSGSILYWTDGVNPQLGAG